MSLEFDRLPLIEVVARFTLAKDLPISAPFILDLWDGVKAEYPEISDLPGLEAPPGEPPSLIITPMLTAAQGVRFTQPANGMSLLVQSKLVSVRWEVNALLEELENAVQNYPRFHAALMPALEQVCSKISDLVGPGGFQPRVANMVYTNFIESTEPLRGKQLASLLSGVVPPHLEDAALFHECVHSWRHSSGVDLRIHAFTGKARTVAPEEVAGYVLKTSAGKDCGPGTSEARNALLLVHEQVCNMFSGLLTPAACNLWGLKS